MGSVVPGVTTRPSRWFFTVHHGFSRVHRLGERVGFLISDDSFITQQVLRKAMIAHNDEMAQVRALVDGFVQRATEAVGPDGLYMAVLDFLDTWDSTWKLEKESLNGQAGTGSEQVGPGGDGEPSAGSGVEASGEGDPSQ